VLPARAVEPLTALFDAGLVFAFAVGTDAAVFEAVAALRLLVLLPRGFAGVPAVFFARVLLVRPAFFADVLARFFAAFATPLRAALRAFLAFGFFVVLFLRVATKNSFIAFNSKS